MWKPLCRTLVPRVSSLSVLVKYVVKTRTMTEVPRSTIYTSETVVKRFTVDGAGSAATHFFLVLSADRYTEDLVQDCQGRVHCYNCNRPIPKRIYFYPTRVYETGVYECNQLPHCRMECMKRTVVDIPNNYDLMTHLFNMYGDVNTAPSRALLYLGVSLEEYHHMIDRQMTMQVEPPRVQSFVGPVFLSAAVLNNHQLVESSLQALEHILNRNQEDVTQAQPDSAPVVHLPPRSLSEGPLMDLFDRIT